MTPFSEFLEILVDCTSFLKRIYFYIIFKKLFIFKKSYWLITLFKNFLITKFIKKLSKIKFKKKKVDFNRFSKYLILTLKSFLTYFLFFLKFYKEKVSWKLYFQKINYIIKKFSKNYMFIVIYRYITAVNPEDYYFEEKKEKQKKINYFSDVSNMYIDDSLKNLNEKIFNLNLYIKNITYYLLFFKKKRTNMFLTLTNFEGKVIKTISTGKLKLDTNRRKLKMSRNNINIFVNKLSNFLKKKRIWKAYKFDRFKKKNFNKFLIKYLNLSEDKKYLFFWPSVFGKFYSRFYNKNKYLHKNYSNKYKKRYYNRNYYYRFIDRKYFYKKYKKRYYNRNYYYNKNRKNYTYYKKKIN